MDIHMTRQKSGRINVTSNWKKYQSKNPFFAGFMGAINTVLRKLEIPEETIGDELRIFIFLRWAACRALEGPHIGQELDIRYLRQNLLWDRLISMFD